MNRPLSRKAVQLLEILPPEPLKGSLIIDVIVSRLGVDHTDAYSYVAAGIQSGVITRTKTDHWIRTPYARELERRVA